MTDRISLDDMTSDQLDQLYNELDRLTAELADYDERAEQQKQRADRAEEECRRYAEADSADAAAGSYAGRVEELGAQLARVRALADRWDNALAPDKPYARTLRAALATEDYAIAQPGRWLHIAFTSPDEMSANTSALAIADHLRAEFDGVSMQITTNAVEAATQPVHIGGQANAEDCPACTGTSPDYPFICPGPDKVAGDEAEVSTGVWTPDPPIGCLTLGQPKEQ